MFEKSKKLFNKLELDILDGRIDRAHTIGKKIPGRVKPLETIGNSSSQIDLIFSQQPNLVISSSVHASLHKNCYCQITLAHINLLVEYPPLYHR